MTNFKNRRVQIFRNIIHKSALKAQTQVVSSLTTLHSFVFDKKLFFSLVPVIKIEINSAQFYRLLHSCFTKIIISENNKCLPVSMSDIALEFTFVKYASRRRINFAWMLQQALFSVI